MRDNYISKEKYCEITGTPIEKFWQKVDEGLPIQNDYTIPLRQALKWEYKLINRQKADLRKERRKLDRLHLYDDLAIAMIKEHMHRIPEKLGHNLKLAAKREETLNEETISGHIGAVSCLVFEAFDAARHDANHKVKLSEYRDRCEVAERYNDEWW